MTMPRFAPAPLARPIRPWWPGAVVAAAAWLMTACGGGLPPEVQNPPGTGSNKLAFAYFQKCVMPLFTTPITAPGGGTNTCASGGCHSNTNGTGGALRLIENAAPVDLKDPANTATQIRASDMYKNYYSALGATVPGQPDQSRLLLKPLIQGVLHGGGQILIDDQDTGGAALHLLDHPPGPQEHQRIQPDDLRHVHAARSRQRQLQHAMTLPPCSPRAAARSVAWLPVALALAAGAARAQTDGAAPATAMPQPAALPTEELAANTSGERPFKVRVTEPYLDLRTSPGRGYPVFFAVGRDEWVTIVLRHTDWYKVRTSGGKLGWATRAQLASTVTEDGQRMSFRDPAFEDYLRRRFDIGAGYGASKTASMFRGWAGVRVSDTLSVEFSSAKVQAASSDTNIWHVNVISEPWSDQRLSPFIGVGIGKYHYVPGKSLVDRTVYNSQLGVAMLGVRYHIAGRLALRVDYSLYTAFVTDNRTRGYQAATAGLSLFY